MRAVIYAILWAILTTLICYLIYEFRQESLSSDTNSNSTEQQVQIIDEVDGANYGENKDADLESSERETVEASNESNLSVNQEGDKESEMPNSQTQQSQKILDERSESPPKKNNAEEKFDYLEKAYIEFKQNSTKLPTSQKFESYIDSVAQVIKSSDYSLLLAGHTDYSKSRSSNNYQIGLKRAEFIKAMLTRRAVPASKIEVKSYGDTSPRVEGNTDEARALNRRVELFIKPKQ